MTIKLDISCRSMIFFHIPHHWLESQRNKTKRTTQITTTCLEMLFCSVLGSRNTTSRIKLYSILGLRQSDLRNSETPYASLATVKKKQGKNKLALAGFVLFCLQRSLAHEKKKMHLQNLLPLKLYSPNSVN